MRLLNTTTFEFREFFDSDVPRYAILSHRWGSDEPSFQDFEKGIQRGRQGFDKINECCKVASEDGLEWAWMDTCCIDKKSSAELTEAINSMYNWYRQAAVCYVYMSDVLWDSDTSDMSEATMEQFKASAWFTRGWTLQELLAPDIVLFYDQGWRHMGTKDEFAEEISEVTEIDTQYLLPRPKGSPAEREPCTKAMECRGHAPFLKPRVTGRWEPSVATRMSWASKRRTSRIEDMAYCLLGIFDINMPLLYGEGRKAFMRLQYEIIKKTNDDSIFAWTADQKNAGVLAYWPSNFANSRYVHKRGPLKTHRRPYALTNQGLDFPITWRAREAQYEVEVEDENRCMTARKLRLPLDCGICGPQGFKNIGLGLVSVGGSGWRRSNSSQIETMEEGPETPNTIKTIFGKKQGDSRTRADQQNSDRNIIIQSEWFYGKNPPGQIYDPLSYKPPKSSGK